VGLCAQHEPVDRIHREVAAALATPDARFVREFSDRARLLYLELPGELERARSFCALVEEHDRRYLAELKLAVREGVRVFEELEAATIDEGAERLVAAVTSIPGIVDGYCTRFAEVVRRRIGDDERSAQ